MDQGNLLNSWRAFGSKLGMHHLLRHFRKPHTPTHGIEFHKVTTTTNDQQIRLPTELLILVASYVQDRRDLLKLCRVSKGFRTICMPFLYRAVDASKNGGPRVEAMLYLYGTLQYPHIANFVVELRLELRPDSNCIKLLKSLGGKRDSRRHCGCDDYDRELGKALHCLRNLRILEITCRLCRSLHLHDYLPHIEMPNLTELRFQCFGCTGSGKGGNISTSILLSPILRTVTTLDLECHDGLLRGPAESYHQFLQMPGVLPNLRTFAHNGSDFCSDLLAARPIERFCLLWRGVPLLHDKIVGSPGHLSHLLLIGILELLRFALPTAPEPYLHLTHIGTITFPKADGDVAWDEMQILAPLRKLEVIEINHMTVASLEPGSEEDLQEYMDNFFAPSLYFVRMLGEQHPRLRLVFLAQRYNSYRTPRMFTEPVVWKKDTRWISHSASYLSHWDILHGMLDEF